MFDNELLADTTALANPLNNGFELGGDGLDLPAGWYFR